jgi:DNA-binding CsgD family transcriptional regulator
MFLSYERAKSLSRVMALFAEPQEEQLVRAKVGEEVMRLIDADYFAYYIWNPRTQRFADRVAINMSDRNLSAYESYFQYRDPITFQLQQRRQATLVEQILPQEELVKTEFFNDFLVRDGLYWGVNLFAWDGERNIGDMRIWRRRSRGRFDHETLALLEIVRPALTAALRRCQRTVPAAVPADGSTAPAAGMGGPRLTPRERDVVELTIQGLPDKVIAQRLGISFPTVRTHVTHIFEKLGVSNRVQLATRLAGLSRAQHDN